MAEERDEQEEVMARKQVETILTNDFRVELQVIEDGPTLTVRGNTTDALMTLRMSNNEESVGMDVTLFHLTDLLVQVRRGKIRTSKRPNCTTWCGQSQV